MIYHGSAFLVGQERSVQANGPAAAGLEQHIAAAQQVFRANLIKNGARIVFAGNPERYTAREVCLDESCYNIDAGALGGQNHVDAGRPGKLGQAHNARFNLPGSRHHQISKLVNYYYQVRQRFQVRKN